MNAKKSDLINDLFEKFTHTTPGVALSVTVQGEVIHRSCYGMADLETHRPITPDTVFNIGSIAKAFTGMCTALLVQDGLISYDDPIRKFLPGFPEAGDLISIRSILTHTSGIPNYWGHFDLETLWLSRDSDALKGAFDIEFGTVGDMWDYSNPAYNLLGLVVEVVSGTALNRFLTERVFAPLEMVDSFVDEQDTFCASKDATYEETAPPAEVEQTAAIPYDEVDGAYTRLYWPEYIPGSGSILSTLTDMHKWDQELYNPTIIDDNLLAESFNLGKLNDGSTLGWGLAWELTRKSGTRAIAHWGAHSGYRADIVRFLDLRITVILLSNFRKIEPMELTEKVSDIVLD